MLASGRPTQSLPNKLHMSRTSAGALRRRRSSVFDRYGSNPFGMYVDSSALHDADNLENEFTARENRVVGFPWSPESVDRALSSVGGTVAATHAVCRGECS